MILRLQLHTVYIGLYYHSYNSANFISARIVLIIELASQITKENVYQGRKCGGVWGGGSPPPEKLSSRSQTTCSRSQNYAFVYMQCFAKQIKYFRNSR
jgi:hypothetical protein